MVRGVAVDNVRACMREWTFAEAYRLHLGDASGFQFGTSSAEKKKKTFVNVIQTCQFLRDQSVHGIARNCGCGSSLWEERFTHMPILNEHFQ